MPASLRGRTATYRIRDEARADVCRGPETTHNTLPELSAELEIAFAQNHIWAMAKWLRMILIILGIFVIWATLSVMTFDDRVRVDYQQFVR